MGKFLLYIKSAPSSSTIEVTLTLHHFLISQITIDPFAKFHRQHRETCQRHVVLLTLRITKCLYSNKILLKFICYQKATKFVEIPNIPQFIRPIYPNWPFITCLRITTCLFSLKEILLNFRYNQKATKICRSCKILSSAIWWGLFFKNIPISGQFLQMVRIDC